MRIVIGSDHGGYALKQEVAAGLRRDGHDVLDVGTDSLEPVDYHDFAQFVGGTAIDGRAERKCSSTLAESVHGSPPTSFPVSA